MVVLMHEQLLQKGVFPAHRACGWTALAAQAATALGPTAAGRQQDRQPWPQMTTNGSATHAPANQKRIQWLESSPYVCPEPVLAKHQLSATRLRNRTVFAPTGRGLLLLLLFLARGQRDAPLTPEQAAAPPLATPAAAAAAAAPAPAPAQALSRAAVTCRNAIVFPTLLKSVPSLSWQMIVFKSEDGARHKTVLAHRKSA